MYEFEDYKRNKGWWFLLQLLIAEQKSQRNKVEYSDYCNEVFEYMTQLPKSVDGKRGIYTYGTK